MRKPPKNRVLQPGAGLCRNPGGFAQRRGGAKTQSSIKAIPRVQGAEFGNIVILNCRAVGTGGTPVIRDGRSAHGQSVNAVPLRLWAFAPLVLCASAQILPSQ